MFDIKCKRKDCEYNKYCNCTSKKIDVNKKAECTTYNYSSKKKTNDIEKIGQPPLRKDIFVNCSSNCLFNKNNKCLANGITVLTCENIDNPNCCTFKEK